MVGFYWPYRLLRNHVKFIRNIVRYTTATLEPPSKNEWPSVRQASIITEGSQEIFETYSLFSYSLDIDRSSAEGQNPRHTEFLIDKRGYIRARWLQRESTAWSKIESLMGEIAILIDEKSRAPAPDDHVH